MAERQRSATRRSRRQIEWSQHNFRSGATASRVIDRACIDPEDFVLEIGPGRGALTRLLASRCRAVLAVEVDPALAKRLANEFRATRTVEVECSDFLERPLPSTPFRVVSNLPYRHTSAILRHLTSPGRRPSDIHVIVQREAGLRYAGEPYGPDRVVSLLLKPWWHCEIAARIGPEAFDPPPAVESVLLWLAKRPRPLVRNDQAALYRDFVSAAFGRRGETLRASLSKWMTRRQLLRLARDLRFDLQSPPSALGFERWLAVFRFFATSATADALMQVRGAAERRPRAPAEPSA